MERRTTFLARGVLVGTVAVLLTTSVFVGLESTGRLPGGSGAPSTAASGSILPGGPGPNPDRSPPELAPVGCLFSTDEVLFNETGLWNGTQWSVTLNGTVQNSTTGYDVFCRPTGNYTYCIGVVACSYSLGGCLVIVFSTYSVNPHCGKVDVLAATTYVNVTFRQNAAPCSTSGPPANPTPAAFYEVNFTEAGLPYGTVWWVTIAGLPAPEARWNLTVAPSMCLRLANGTYSYSAGTQNGHWSANGGSFTVRGPATRPARIVCGLPEGTVVVLTAVVTVPLDFFVLTYAVEFDAAGLPDGTVWWVNLTGGQINGTMSLESRSASTEATLVNQYLYNFTSSTFDKDYAWTRTPSSVNVSGHDLVETVTFRAVTFPVTFTESHLPAGMAWYVNLTGQPPLSNVTTGGGGTISVQLTNGSYGYTLGAAGTWKSPAGSFSIDGPSGTTYIAVPFTYDGRLPFTPPVETQVLGPFLGGGVLDLEDTFGVYTGHAGYAPVVWVNGSIDGVAVSFVNQGNGLWNASVDLGSLPSGAVLNVVATYPNGSYATSSYGIPVVTPPDWLVSFLSWTHGGSLSVPLTGEWNNSYQLDLLGDFDLSSQFSVSIPFPSFAGGGSYGLIPAIDLSLALASGGTLALGATFTVSTPEIDAGPVAVSLSAGLSAYGNFSISGGSVVWDNASLTFDLSASASVNIPIAGYTFNVPGYGSVTIGLSATITVSPSVAATLVLLPSTSAGNDFLPGLSVMLGKIFARIGAALTVSLNAGVGGLSISGGGSVDVSMNVQPSPPYIEGGTISGEVFVNYQVLWWSGTLWSDSGTLYQWGNKPGAGGPDGEPAGPHFLGGPNNSTPPVYIPRYYAAPLAGPYDQDVWAKGRTSGVAIRNVYPFSTLAAADGPSSALLVYSNDNVSLPEDDGLTLEGLEFNATSGALSPVNITLPALGSEVAFDPETTELVNGTYAVVWNAIPFNGTAVPSPFNITSTVLQLAYFNASTHRWSGPFDLVSTSGYAQSFALDADAAGLFVLDQSAPGLVSNDSTLLEVSAHGKLLASLPVQGVSRVVAFRAASGLAVVQDDNGSYSLLNVTTGSNVSATAGLGCPVSEMEFVQDSPGEVATLLAGQPNDTLVLYGGPSSSVAVPLPRNVSTMTATSYEGRVVVTIGGPFGVRVYLVSGTSAERLYSVAGVNITHLVTAVAGSHLVVFTTEAYGNYTPESGRESFSYEDLDLVNVDLGSYAVTFDEKGLPTGTPWSVTLGTPAVTVRSSGRSAAVTEPAGLLPWVVNASGGFALASTNPSAAVPVLNVSGSATVTVDFGRLGTVRFSETGLPNGTAWAVSLVPKAAGGPVNQSGTSTSGLLNFTLVAGHWRWTVSSSDRTYAPASYHGTVSPGRSTVVVHVRFKEVTSRVTFSREGLPSGKTWTLAISGGPTVSGSGRSLVLHLPNGTYNYTITSSDPAYTANAASGRISVVAPRPLLVATWFTDPPPG